MDFLTLTETEQLNDPTRWEYDVAQISRDALAQNVSDPVMLVGSSTFVMWETLHNDLPLPGLRNHAFGGSTLYDAAFYAPDLILPFSPRVLVVSAGDNDVARGKHPKLVFEDLRMLTKQVWYQREETPIHFVTIKPSTGREEFLPRQREVNERVRRWSETEPRVRYVDIATPMLGADDRPRPDLFLEDGIHLNAKGYAIWAKVLMKSLEIYR